MRQLLEDLAEAQAEEQRVDRRKERAGKERETEEETTDQEVADAESIEEEELQVEEPKEEEVKEEEDLQMEEPKGRRRRALRETRVPGSKDDDWDDVEFARTLSLSEVETQLMSQVTATEAEDCIYTEPIRRRGRVQGRGASRTAARERGRGGSGRGGGGRDSRGRSGRRRRPRSSDEDSGFVLGADEPSRRQEGNNDRMAALISKHRQVIDTWTEVIVARAREKKEDEEKGAPQRWGTQKAEEEKVTATLGMQSFRWKMWLDVDAAYDQRTRCWE